MIQGNKIDKFLFKLDQFQLHFSEGLQYEFWFGDIKICVVTYFPFSAILEVWENEVLIYIDYDFDDMLLTS